MMVLDVGPGQKDVAVGEGIARGQFMEGPRPPTQEGHFQKSIRSVEIVLPARSRLRAADRACENQR
jgi:hypothetical protein